MGVCACASVCVLWEAEGGGGGGRDTDDPRIFGLREASFSVVLLTHKREYILADKACAFLVRP